MFVVFVYWICKARNEKFEAMVHVIMADVRIKMASHGYQMKEGPKRRIMEERWGLTIQVKGRLSYWVKWTNPLVGMAKLNTDGSWKNRRGSWGAAIREHDGSMGPAAQGNSEYCCIDEIELDAVEQRIKLAMKYEYPNFVINMDSSIVIHHVKMDKPPSNVRQSARLIKATVMHSCVIKYCYREANSLADELANVITVRE